MRTASKTLSHAWAGALPPAQWAGAVNPLPGDMEIGTATVTFSDVRAGSEIRIYSPAGIELAGIETGAADQVLVWPVFAPAYNLATIRIVHLAYKLKEFTYRPMIGEQSIPIQQDPDPWYKNPL